MEMRVSIRGVGEGDSVDVSLAGRGSFIRCSPGLSRPALSIEID